MNTGGGAGLNTLRLDPAVRQAMAYATDKNFIKDHIYKGYAEIGSAILSPIYGELYWAPGPAEEYEFDLAKANATLDAAGYAWNSDHTRRSANATNPWNPNAQLKFNIIIEAELVEDRDTAFFLKDEWAKVGIQIDPEIVSTGQCLRVQLRPHDFVLERRPRSELPSVRADDLLDKRVVGELILEPEIR
jgi:peptide/nickel transport system substrate-binding protein